LMEFSELPWLQVAEMHGELMEFSELPWLQVAEMHGELMEFNELLQKQLLCRESQLKCLTEELVSLRGPVSTHYSVC